MRGQGRGRSPLIVAVLCVALFVASTAWGGPQISDSLDCRQMGIGVQQRPPGHPDLPVRRSAWLGYLRDAFGYRWTSADDCASLLSHPTAFAGATIGSPRSNLGRLTPGNDLIGLDHGVASLAWACGADASVVAGWLAPPTGGKTGQHGRWLRASDGFSLLLTALRNTPAPNTADPVDTVRGFYVALGRAVASETTTGRQQLQRWCCGDAFVRLANNLTALSGDNAFCLVSMQVVATTRIGHLATVRVIRTADQRVAGTTSRSTLEDQFYLRYTNNGWQIYK